MVPEEVAREGNDEELRDDGGDLQLRRGGVLVVVVEGDLEEEGESEEVAEEREEEFCLDLRLGDFELVVDDCLDGAVAEDLDAAVEEGQEEFTAMLISIRMHITNIEHLHVNRNSSFFLNRLREEFLI